MNTYKWILFLLVALVACKKEDSRFEASSEGLTLSYRPMAGGAMLKYTLPNNEDIFAMNIRYTNAQGDAILKTCGYSGDSVLLDGFTRAQDVNAQICFINNKGYESESFDFSFKTHDSAPWSFFETIKVGTSWSGFQVIYGESSIATGMAHVFYLGTNPLNHKVDTIPVVSFPIRAKGDTLYIPVQQMNEKNTVIIRTEDFKGYRVRQEIYPDIESFNAEKYNLKAEDFDDLGLSVENDKAKIGKKYLFDGELKGRLRMENRSRLPNTPVIIYGGYVAGPNAIGKPFIIDLKEKKVPAKIRLYCLYPLLPMWYGHPLDNPSQELGYIWGGQYEDKVPCNITIYGNSDSSDPNAPGWIELGKFTQDPKSEERWPKLPGISPPGNLEDFDARKPISIEILFPAANNHCRYLKMVVNDTFNQFPASTIDRNKNNYFTLHEIEVFVKKEL